MSGSAGCPSSSSTSPVTTRLILISLPLASDKVTVWVMAVPSSPLASLTVIVGDASSSAIWPIVAPFDVWITASPVTSERATRKISTSSSSSASSNVSTVKVFEGFPHREGEGV